MHEWWATLPLEANPSTALVIDASESALPYWSDIQQLTQKLLAELPGTAQPALFFLGHPDRYEAFDFANQSAKWHESHKCRLSLIGPIFERLQEQDNTTIVILGAGRLFDWDDWIETELLQRTRVVCFGSHALTNGRHVEWEPSVERLRAWLYDPVVRVEIGGRSAMPFYWDNSAYVWDGARLVAEKAVSFAVHVGFLCPAHIQPPVLAQFASGEQRALSLTVCRATLATEEWTALTPTETTLFRTCITQGNYNCEACGCEHPANQLRCDDGSLLGRPIYPTLEGVRGIIQLRDFGNSVGFSQRPCPALQVNPHTVSVQRGGQADLYCFNKASGEWCKSNERIAPYQPIGKDTYVVIL